MHPAVIALLVYVVLPLLKCFRLVWHCVVYTIVAVLSAFHFLTGGIFLPRRPIERQVVKTKVLKVYLESNVLNRPFDEVRGMPEQDQRVPSRSATPTPSESSWISENGERHQRNLSMSAPPYFNIELQSTEEGQHYVYHG